MNRLSRILSAATLGFGLAVAGVPAVAQQAPASAPPLKQASPAAIAAAKEILAMKNASAMYASAVPNIVQQTRDQLMQSNLNYQKDLNEFSEQDLKDLVTFYKSPLGQKLLSSEPRAIQFSMSYMHQWAQVFGETVNGEFRAEMRKRGKEICLQ